MAAMVLAISEVVGAVGHVAGHAALEVGAVG